MFKFIWRYITEMKQKAMLYNSFIKENNCYTLH